MTMKYPFIKPDVSKDTIELFKEYIEQIHEKGIYSNNGFFVKKLEDRFTDEVGKGCVLAANATLILDAIHYFFADSSMSFPAFTFPATNLGRIKPASVADCDENGIAVHRWFHKVCITTIPFGDFTAAPERPDCDYWIVDAAAGIDPEFRLIKRLLSKGANLVVGSLHATKTLSAGEGGVVWGDSDLITRLKCYQNFGFSGHTNSRELSGEGSNHKMSEFSAAFCLAYMEKDFERSWNERVKTALAYQTFLKERGYQTILSPQAFWFKARVDAKQLCESLQEQGLDARRYYYPIQFPQEMLKGYRALDMSERGVCFPTRGFSQIEMEDIFKIMEKNL